MAFNNPSAEYTVQIVAHTAVFFIVLMYMICAVFLETVTLTFKGRTTSSAMTPLIDHIWLKLLVFKRLICAYFISKTQPDIYWKLIFSYSTDPYWMTPYFFFICLQHTTQYKPPYKVLPSCKFAFSQKTTLKSLRMEIQK